MLYQQNGKIEVIVRKEDSETSDGERDADQNVGGGNTSENNKLKRQEAKRQKFIRTNVTHAIAAGRQALHLGINYYLTGVGYEYGDQAYQDICQRQWEVVQDVSGVATSVAMGAAYGAAGGPLGSALGATFGAITSVASLTTKYANRQREYGVKMFKQENGINYLKARASVNLTNGRLR